MSLKALRKQINETDTRIVQLLNQRAKLVLQVKREKEKKGSNAYVPQREVEVLQRVAKLNEGPLDSTSIKQIYREILSSCRMLQKPISVSFLGPEATFTHQAAVAAFGSSCTMVAKESIEQVFQAVEKRESSYGVVPVENSTEGAVTNTLDMFLRYDVQICSEVFLPVSHLLLGKGSLKEVTVVFSNPQALAQCRNTLNKHLPHARTIETTSTTVAAQKASRSKKAAAIASELAAKIYELKVLRRNMEDEPMNRTRFLVIGKEQAKQKGKGKTSFVFSVPHRAGSLLRALQPLYENGINMTMIASRPSRLKLWEYVFFVDLEGYQSEPALARALAQVKSRATFLKVLGSYPEAVLE